MMKKDIQMLTISIVVALGLSALCIYYLIFSDGGLSRIEKSEIEEQEREEVALPLPTSNVGDIVNALMRELLDEKMLLLEEEEDIALIISDDEEIKGFDQSINEDEL